MSDWRWDYNTDDPAYHTNGLPPGVVAEVERLATELASLGRDAVRAGHPTGQEGGLRSFDILGGRGVVQFLVVPHRECVYVCNIVWYE